ncbi:MAG: thioredoxin family protein, partial [Pseudomonadota bacterium]
EAVDQALANGQGVFVDFTATWCATCQVNKLRALNTHRVRDALEAKNIVFMTADFTRKDPVIAKELEMRGRPGVPMYLLYAPGETVPRILPQVLTERLVLGELDRIRGTAASH